MCQTIVYKLVTIRKSRRCFGCDEHYPKGAKMHAHVTRGDGRIYTLHMCDRCNAASNRQACGDVYYSGELKELWEPEVQELHRIVEDINAPPSPAVEWTST